jgi:hypothetical protein
VESGEIVSQPLPGYSGEIKNVHDAPIDTTPALSGFEDGSKMVDGWILGSNSELLFWVPPSIRDGLWRPRNITIINEKVLTKLDLRSFRHGKSWTQCKRSR